MAESSLKRDHRAQERVPEQKEAAALGDTPESPQTPVVTRPVRHYRAYVFQGYMIVATIAFAILFLLARQLPYLAFDVPVERAVQSIHNPAINVLMEFVSGLGFNPLSYLLSGLAILFVFVVGLRWETVMLLFAAVGVSLLGAVVKLIVHRARPSADLVNVFSKLNDYSFPSGHVLLFTAFIGFLIFLMYTLTPHSWARTLALIFLGGLVALVGLSRVYLGEHWPSDVLGGYLLGSLWLLLTVYVYRWGKQRFFVNQPIAKEEPT